MEDIDLIYRNRVGIAFRWKSNSNKTTSKVQLIFKETCLLLSKEELLLFSGNIERVLSQGQQLRCADCKGERSCRSLLLDSPAPQIAFSVSYNEVLNLKDLVDGTLFQWNLTSYLTKNGFMGNHN